MIGERIESQHSLPLMAFLFLAAGVGLVVAGLATGVHGMVTGAVLPLALGGSLWLFGQERPLTAMFRDTGWRSKPTASRSWSLTPASRTSRQAAGLQTPHVSARRPARSRWCTRGECSAYRRA